MSGNSRFSRRQTAPIVSSRCGGGVARCGVAARRHRAMKVSRYLPIWSSSPSPRLAPLDPAAVDERAVEAALVLDREARRRRSTSTAWRRETVTSSRKIPQSGERPIVVRSPCGMELSPGGRRRSARRARAPRCRAPRAVAGLLGRPRGAERHRRVARASSFEQVRAAPGAVVRGLRVLEAALGAVDWLTGSAGPRRPAADAFAVEDRRQALDVDLRRARSCRPSSGAARRAPREDVDLAVQDAAPVRDLVLLLRRARRSAASARRRRARRDRAGLP